ncbi:Sarcosine dehydrogenase-2C mitochondrial [Heracleum sosnowskyi]|uniref:Sarcosine dehydrogenase-2C mitochondrial n=1 Tax=Heracleum sosnowskyi TaxID=360622 RepID=A0AAD8GT28_9APIA|nr:Sarcosine dehydrogenase-2C mitochondrial [Heracleum sosnowskyi]
MKSKRKKGGSKREVNVKTRKLIDKNKLKSSPVEKSSAPLRSIYCLKNKSQLKEIEKKEDCFILDYVPDDPLHKISISSSNNNNELSIVAEKGQVACRDFPHSRHTCAKYPFNRTKHESYCQLCYCFVCDTVAPCIMWTGSSEHCHAIDTEDWEFRRECMQVFHKAKKTLEEAEYAMNNKSSMSVSLRKTVQKFRRTLLNFSKVIY